MIFKQKLFFLIAYIKFDALERDKKMQELSSIFKAEPKSVFEIICSTDKTGFYMPSYQRPYSWTATNINDLFCDFYNVFYNLLETDDAIIFLGSLLTVNDDGTSLFPRAEKQHPPTIKLVIDGQQRLSTLIMIITCIHEKLRISLPILQKNIDKVENSDEIRRALIELEDMTNGLIEDTKKFIIVTPARDLLYKFQPKITRSQMDCWGKDEKEAFYTSPIASFLFEFQKHILSQEGNKGFKKFNEKLLDAENSSIVIKNIDEIRKQLDFVIKGFTPSGRKGFDSETEKYLALASLKSENLQGCLDFDFDEELISYSNENKGISELLFLNAFTLFVLRRVCLTYVEVNSESYAFDMFEALNTTGEPLTAYETFVPKVIEHIQKKSKDESTSTEEIEANHARLKRISSRFNNLTNPEEKKKLTKAIILGFIRAYEGDVKVTHLRDQRDAFLKSYSKCNPQLRDEYLEYLEYAVNFICDRWQTKSPELTDLVAQKDLDLANLCFKYLIDLKHEISQSLFIQFIIRDDKYNKGIDYFEFYDALKAITSFCVLWRAMSNNTDGIDAVYKKIHTRGIEINGIEATPFQLKGNLNSISLSKLKQILKQELFNKIDSKNGHGSTHSEQWITICASQDHLSKPAIIKMLVLAGFHYSELNDNQFNFNNNLKNHFLNCDTWEVISRKDIIKPLGTKNDVIHGWHQDLLDIGIVNKLGNLLIDPDNSIKTDTCISWQSALNRMDAELSHSDINNIDTIASDPTLSENTKKKLAELKFKRKYKEIMYAQEWDSQAIKNRTHALLTNAWRNLITWLD